MFVVFYQRHVLSAELAVCVLRLFGLVGLGTTVQKGEKSVSLHALVRFSFRGDWRSSEVVANH